MTLPQPIHVGELAKPGQRTGSRRAPLDEHYRDAAKLAHDNPGQPVIVNEYPLENVTEDELPTLQKFVHNECATARQALNEGLDPEQYAVSGLVHRPDGVMRTTVTFHPDGRPITRRGKEDSE